MPIAQKLIVVGVLFLLTIATGLWAGFTTNGAASALHKLLGLAAFGYFAAILVHSARPGETPFAFALVIGALALSVIVLVLTGSVLTIPTLANSTWLNLHRVATALALIATAATAKLFIVSR